MSLPKKCITLAIVGMLFVSGCGQAMLSYRMNALNGKFEKRLQFKETSLLPIKVGELYNAQLEAENGTPPYRWEIIEGELPKGLKFEKSRGEISGIPESETGGPIVVILTDSSNNLNNYAVKTFPLE